MFNPRRQHPVLILFTVIRYLREMIIPIILLFVSGLKGDSPERVFLTLGIGCIAFLVLCGWAIFSWYLNTFHIDQGELRIQSGVLIKNKRFIPRERIQTIHVSEGLLQRLFGVVKVEIETAGGQAKAEATMAAISRADAEELRAYITRQTKKKEPELKDEQGLQNKKQLQHVLSAKELLIAAATSGSIGIVFSFISAVTSQVNELLPDLELKKWLGSFTPDINSVLILIVALAMFSWLISIVGIMLKYANFTLTCTEDKIHITRGLLERREFTIPRKRIQAVRIVEGILRQPFGLASLVIVSAGFGPEKGEATVLYPLVKKERVTAFLHEVVPDLAVAEKLTPLPARALPRYIFKPVISALIPVVPLTVFVPYGGFSCLLVLSAFGYGVLRYKDAGWAVREKTLLIRYRRLVRTTALIPVNRIQATEMRQSFMQRRKGLATFTVFVVSGIAGTGFRIVDAEEKHKDYF